MQQVADAIEQWRDFAQLARDRSLCLAQGGREHAHRLVHNGAGELDARVDLQRAVHCRVGARGSIDVSAGPRVHAACCGAKNTAYDRARDAAQNPSKDRTYPGAWRRQAAERQIAGEGKHRDREDDERRARDVIGARSHS